MWFSPSPLEGWTLVSHKLLPTDAFLSRKMQKMRFRPEPLGEPTAFSQIPYFQGEERGGEGSLIQRGCERQRKKEREKAPAVAPSPLKKFLDKALRGHSVCKM